MKRLFDAGWYVSSYGQDIATGVNPFSHYIRNGISRGFNPHPLFDSDWYLSRNPDVQQSGVHPLYHYVLYGGKEKRSPHPLFDANWYVKRNPDALSDEFTPLEHFLRFGVERLLSPHPLFDGKWYLTQNPDVREIGINPLYHYVGWGECEGRSPHPLLNARFYNDQYPDVKIAGVGIAQHYLLHGIQEGRQPSAYFDPRYYRAVHRDDEDAQTGPLAHYMAHAREPGNHPTPFFDNDWYAEQYLADKPDVVPLVHFVEEGEAAGLRPHPLYDEALYLALNRDVSRLFDDGHLSSGFWHFVNHGARELGADRYRHFSFVWGDHFLDYDSEVYGADNPDVGQDIASGRFRNGLEHLFATGWREAIDGLRALYSARHAVRLINSIAGYSLKSNGKHLCLFAHYDRDDLVDPYVVIYLKALRKADVDIVFITATQDEGQLAKVKPLVSRILVKNEAGRDFGSWWLALKMLGVDCGNGYDRVIFANDSIYFPVRPIEPLFADMEMKGYNLYGLSDSREADAYHLQSFFLAFDKKAQAAVFPRFIERFRRNYVLTKWGQIREYELGLTQTAQEAGLSVGAYFSIDDAREDVARNPTLARWSTIRHGPGHLNPTHDLWDLMIGHYGWPGLKIELLRDNPRNVDGFEALPRLIADGDIAIKEIKAHLERVMAPVSVLNTPVPVVASPKVELIERIRGTGRAQGDRLVLFAHYDPGAIIDPHIVHQVKTLEVAGCAVAFITPVRNAKQLATITPYVRDVLMKSDTGRDFGSWDLALRTLGDEVRGFGSVIWMNDSTYFPLFDPAPIFKIMEARGADFWGLVDSYNVKWHIMSWFWAFGRGAIESGWLDWYRSEYNPSHTKWAQIHNYEIRLPGLIRASGLKTDVYVCADDMRRHILETVPDHPRIDSARRGNFTMTHDFWRELITHFRCPALKVELVRDNPLGIDISMLLKVIESHTDYDPRLIRDHLLRVKVGHLPPPARADFSSPL
jgi:lipopolysaccharide biosynthesis protein